MGHNGRGKQKRSTRKSGSGRALHDRGDAAEVNRQVGGEELASHSGGAFINWSEEELESHLLMNLQHVFNEATVRLSDLGYEENDVLKAILNNGHCYGEKDVLSNVLDNTLKFLINGKSNDNLPAFASLQQLMDMSLGGMVHRVQQAMPHLSRRDAMLRVCRMNNPQYPKCFKFMPSSMNDLGMRNVTTEVDEGFGANSLFVEGNSVSEFRSGNEAPVEQNEVLQNAESQDVISSLSDIFRDFNLDESIEYVPLDEKDEMIIDLLNQMKDLETQVEERKDWAHQRHMQAIKKVGDSRVELEKLRMERKETGRLETAKLWSLECSLSVIEDTWRESTDQLDRINALRSKLESEYDEMSAELEASKLSASESARNCAEVAKREKKSLRRLLALEKQKTELHNDTAVMEQQISELETQLVQVEAAQKDVQAKQKEAQKAKESALEQLEDERRLLKTTVPTNKREQASMHLKLETDIQRHKDEQQRLEQELSRLKMSSQASQLNPHLTNLPMVYTKGMETHGGLTEIMCGELDNQEDYCSDRNCFICAEKEVSVVFLPCAHQLLCSNCSDSYGKEGKAECPCCGLSIEERIQVFGAESS